MVPVITFSFFTTIIPCKVGTKNTKSMKCHQIRRFCWLRLKTHKGEMKILCILAQQKWFQKSFFHNFKKMPTYGIFRIIIKYVLQQKSRLKSHFHFLRFWSNFFFNSVTLTAGGDKGLSPLILRSRFCPP